MPERVKLVVWRVYYKVTTPCLREKISGREEFQTQPSVRSADLQKKTRNSCLLPVGGQRVFGGIVLK